MEGVSAMTSGTARVVEWVRRSSEALERERTHLNKLDADIGDGDHGANMARGFTAARTKLDGDVEGGPAGALKTVGMTLLSTVGGAAGPLYGSFFIGLAGAAGDAEELDATTWAAALEAGVAAVQRRGKAELEDKTMVDALLPARDALAEAAGAGEAAGAALARAAEAADRGAEATVPLVARKGRASYLGERSAGHLDPGAASTALLLHAAADAWGTTTSEGTSDG
jgi:dihydroxyacetone kinase-like protein